MTVEHEVTPRLAATTILVRARGDQPEILLLKRGEHARFMPNAYVFAGGALDLGDESAEVYGLCEGLDDERASEHLALPANGLRFFVAAVREAFEECGLLLAYDDRGRLSFAELCRAQGWRLAVDKLAFFSHWITPPGSVRFDTRFFLCSVPSRQTACLAGSEMSQLVWRTAAEALAEHAGRKLLLMYPTRAILEEIAALPSIDELFDYASRPRAIAPITPVMPPGFRADGR
jgi:8-oxo-dGTP pyrophosphatase MutT (NUDIX family)